MALQPVKAMNNPHQVISLVEGWEGSGKTHFCLTSPDPIGIINLDRGLDGVIQPFLGKKQISVAQFHYRKAGKDAGARAEKVWGEMEKDIHRALETCRTTVIDTATEVWEVIRLANLGALEGVRERYYAEVNRIYKDIIDHAYDTGHHLLMIHSLTEEYRGEKTTGNMIPKGMKQARYWARQRLLLQYQEGFTGTILKARGNQGAVGMDLADPDFTSYAMALFPDADEEEFE